jgi:hypothetical protein
MKYLILPLALLSATAFADFPTFNSKGQSANRIKAQENALFSAHLECGRTGFWADLNTVSVETNQIVSRVGRGNAKRNQVHYEVVATGSCGHDYLRFIPVPESVE